MRSLHGVSLNQQGIILVSCLLFLELIFVGSLWSLLIQAETDAIREEHSKEISRRTNALIKNLYIMGTSIESYIASRNKDYLAEYQNSKSTSEDSLDWLARELKDDNLEKERLARIDFTIREALARYGKLIHDTQHMPVEQAIDVLRTRKLEFQTKFNLLASDMVQLINAERGIQETSPRNQRVFRSRSRTILQIGLLVNVIMAILLGLFFTRTIGSRLKVILDNTVKLSRRQPLNSKLNGDDELSLLDGAFHDMSARIIKDETMLKASETRVRAIIEQLPVGLMIVTPDENVEFANATLKNMMGENPENDNLIGRPLSTFFTKNDAKENSLPAPTGSARVIEKELLKSNGELLPVEFSFAKFADGLEPTSERQLNLAIVLDVGERRVIQKIRQAFVSTVSHELKTPLTSIGGFISLLLGGQYGELSPDAFKEAATAEKNMSRLMRLIGDLLDLEKMETGSISIIAVPCLLSQILKDSIGAVFEIARARNIALLCPYPDIELFVDPDRITQVVINLLSNAVKFSNVGGAVKIEVLRHAGQIEVQIIDTGRGIPAEFKEAIFERFQQLEVSDAASLGGTGLGLSIARAIIEKHRGTIGVISDFGKGSTFWFKLPCENDDD